MVVSPGGSYIPVDGASAMTLRRFNGNVAGGCVTKPCQERWDCIPRADYSSRHSTSLSDGYI